MQKKKIKSWVWRFEWTLVILLFLLIAVRAAAPYVGKSYINRVLSNKLESYEGSIDDLSLRVITGSYFIHGLKIFKKTIPNTPFLAVDHLNVHLDWGMLFNGEAVMNLEILDAKMNFIDSKKPQKRQLKVSEKEQQHWSEALDAIIPLSIEEIVLKKLVLQFENRSIKGAEKNKIFISEASIFNLVDPEVRRQNLSPVSVIGEVNGHAPVNVQGGVNIIQKKPAIDLAFKFEKFDLTSTNKLLKFYVPVDVTSGMLSLLGEVRGNMQNLEGYSRVYLNNLDIIEIEQEYKSGTHFLFEWVGGFVNWVLNALNEGALTTEIPFSLKNNEFKVDSSKAFFNTLKNLGSGLPYEFKSEKDEKKE